MRMGRWVFANVKPGARGYEVKILLNFYHFMWAICVYVQPPLPYQVCWISPVTLAKNLEVSATKTILVVCISPKSPPSHTKSPGKFEHGK